MIAIFFLGAGYFVSCGSAPFAILWSLLLIYPCLPILKQAFPKIFHSALYGVIVSIIIGKIFGDWLLDNFYPFNIDGFTISIWHRIFSIITVFYIYLCLAITKEFIKKYKTIKKEIIKHNKKYGTR